jgi:N-glycosylase/DNA lyase
MRYHPDAVGELRTTYDAIKEELINRLSEFREIWDSKEEIRAIHELLFCILTPQSKAQVCWGAIEDMTCGNILLSGDYDQVLQAIGMVRFKYRKTGYLIEARDRFHNNGEIELLSFIEGFSDPHETRRWFVKNIKGLGYKESSHFLRNIGLGDDLAILDRHILRTLVKANVIGEIPSSLNDKRYLEIEELMRRFAADIHIPLAHLDIVIWYIATGSIFK